MGLNHRILRPQGDHTTVPRHDQSSSRVNPLVHFDDASLVRDPLRTLAKAGIIALLAIVVGTIVPGLIAHRAGVFYQETMLARLPPDARTQLAEFSARKDTLRKQIAEIDRLLDSPLHAKPDDIAPLLTQRSEYQRAFDSATPPIHLMPFFLNPIMFVWSAAYTTLGWLIFLAAPRRTKPKEPSRKTLPKVIIAAFGVYAAYNWPVWMRNFVLTNEGRRVYSFANIDIAPASFWCQELTSILFAVLLAVVWYQWTSFLQERRAELSFVDKSPSDHALDHKAVEGLSLTFLHWQIASILLAVTFLYFSAVFWDLILRRGDLRYAVPAVTIHVCWLVSWIFVTLPLLLTWYSWQSMRLRALCEAAQAVDGKDEGNARLKALKDTLSEIQPIGMWNLAASGTIAVVSFILPIAQAILK
jgi:hypothetical protein